MRHGARHRYSSSARGLVGYYYFFCILFLFVFCFVCAFIEERATVLPTQALRVVCRIAGLKRSAITSLDKSIVLSIADTQKVETLCARGGRVLVSHEYFREMYRVANDKLQFGRQRMEQRLARDGILLIANTRPAVPASHRLKIGPHLRPVVEMFHHEPQRTEERSALRFDVGADP